MNCILKYFLLVAVMATTSAAWCQSIPPELRGMYSGKYSVANYFQGSLIKASYTLILTLDENTCAVQLIDSAGNLTPLVNGEATTLGKYIAFKAPLSVIEVIGGRLEVKGKPGKYTATGQVEVALSGYMGFFNGKCTLKKVS